MNGTLNTNLQNTSNVNKAYADIKSIKKELEALSSDVSKNTLDINSLNTDVSNIKSDISEQVTTKNVATENISISNAAHALNSLTVDGEITADKITVKELIYDIQDDTTVENLTAKVLTSNNATINNEDVNILHVNKYLSLPEGTTLRKPYITSPYVSSPTITGNVKVQTSLPQYTKNIALGLDDENNLCKVLIQNSGSSETTEKFIDKNSLYSNAIGISIDKEMLVFNKEIYYVIEDKLYNYNNELIYTFVNKPRQSLMKYSENEAHFISQVDNKYNLYLFNINTFTETLVAEDITSISGTAYYTSYGQFYLTGTVGAYEIHYIGPTPEDDTLLRYLINSINDTLDINSFEPFLLLNNNMLIATTSPEEQSLIQYDESVDPHIKITTTLSYNIDISVALQNNAIVDSNNAVEGAQIVLSGIGYTDGYNFVQDDNVQYCKIDDKTFIIEKPKYSNKLHIKTLNGKYFIPSNTWSNNKLLTYVATTKFGATIIELVYYNANNYNYIIYAFDNNYLKLTGSSIEYSAEIIQLGNKYLFNGELYDYIIYNGSYYNNGDTSVIQNSKVYLDVTDTGISGPSTSFINCDITFGHFDVSKDKLVSTMTFSKCNIHNLKMTSLNISFKSDTENNFDNCYINDSTSTVFSCNKFKNSFLTCAATSFKANEIKNSNLKFTKSCTLSHMGTEYITSGSIKVNVVNSILKNADTTNCNLVNCKEE